MSKHIIIREAVNIRMRWILEAAFLVIFVVASLSDAHAVARLTGFQVIPNPVVAGRSITLQLFFDPPGEIAIPIVSSSDTRVVPIQAVPIPNNNAPMITRSVNTNWVPSEREVTLRARWGNVTRTVVLVVRPAVPDFALLAVRAVGTTTGQPKTSLCVVEADVENQGESG